MQKIVINRCFGGFGLSEKGLAFYNQHMQPQNVVEYDFDIPRDSKALVATVEILGEGSFGPHAELKVVEIPDSVKWIISEYDGMETVEEAHRSWC